MKKHCQFSEEEHLLKIFEEIGHRHKLCDIGARLQFSNARMLIEKFDYAATLIELQEKHCKVLSVLFQDQQNRTNITIVHTQITPWNVNKFVGDADFLTIDIDSNDWWVWAHVEAKPRVVCIEVNNKSRNDGLSICTYNQGMQKFNFGKMDENASPDAMKLLGKIKGYDYIGRTGVNMFFVDKDCRCQYRLDAESSEWYDPLQH